MNPIAQLEAYLAEDPEDAFTRFALAMEYAKVGRTDEALAIYRGLVEGKVAYLGAWYHLGKLYEATGRRKEALKAYADGMMWAGSMGETHTYNELMAAKTELEES